MGVDPIPASVIKKLLEEIYTGNRNLDRQLFKETAYRLMAGVTDGFGKDFPKIKYNSPDFDLLDKLTYNAGTFAAFKNHSQIGETVKLLKDAEGNLRSKSDFIKEARKLNDTYNKRYLSVEYDQAVTSGRMAKKWADAERTQNLYPNLTYVAVMDDRTRPLHRKWHGVTLPIDHVFWNSHYPPNDWACRCTVRRTDKAAEDRGLKVEDMPSLPKQFNINVGKEGKVFNNDHPYFKTNNFKTVANFAKNALIGVGRNQLKAHYAVNPIKGKTFNSQIGQMRVHSKELFTTSSEREYTKINALFNVKQLINDAVYIKSALDSKNNPMIRYYHYLMVEVSDKAFYLNVREMKDGSLVLYSITDKIK